MSPAAAEARWRAPIIGALAGRRFSRETTAHGLARTLGCQHPEVDAELARMFAVGLVEHDAPTGRPQQRYRWRLTDAGKALQEGTPERDGSAPPR